ncbi:hypothetical protein K440DRAFT_554654 [Wilcoxina mikolae CBS 423.85]|nr:hypothetical protein K440DRAFT_554654 [Wilcoxina mikolae CBS 423.85]
MATRSSQSQLRPPTPKSVSDTHSSDHHSNESVPPLPQHQIQSRASTSSNPPRRTPLSFLRRSKSGDPVRKTMPVVAPTPPKLPDPIANGSSNNTNNTTGFPRHLLGKDVRDSVDILSGRSDDDQEHTETNGDMSHTQQHPQFGGFVPGRKSTDSVIGPAGEYVRSSSVPISEDPYANIGSMAHRGRYSYASSAVSTVNSPRRVRRRKDPTPFNILVIGARNSGKTSFLRFLRQSLALKKRGQHAEEPPQTDHTGTTSDSDFKSTYIETEIDGERIGLTLWDSAGLEKNVVDLQLRETVAFIEAKFEETFSEETKVVRAPGVRDTHIHCVFLLLDPARLTPNNHYLGKMGSPNEVGGLDPDLDISVFKALHGKTIVVPVISKADTCTSKHMEHLKEIVRKGLRAAGEDPLESLELEVEGEDDDEETVPVPKSKRGSLPEVDEDDYANTQDDDEDGSADPAAAPTSVKETGFSAGLTFIPLSVVSPDSYEPGEPVGRHFPWGFADPYDEKHCDFARLKYSVFSEWRAELREKSREYWYENWRSERLGSRTRRRF